MYNKGSKVKINVQEVLSHDLKYSGFYQKDIEQMIANPDKIYEVKGHEKLVPFPRNMICLRKDDETYFSDKELIFVSRNLNQAK